MPRRRDKRTDTYNSDDYEQYQKMYKVTHFGTFQFNRLLAPDQIDGDDSTKYSVRAWSNTLTAHRLMSWPERKLLFQRAINCLPYSYKIWQMYLQYFTDFCLQRSLLSNYYRYLNNLFYQALYKLSRMPRIWLMYGYVLYKQHLISKTRAVYNWSFRNLPLTQHYKIWHKFSLWAMRLDNSSTALSVVPRYLKLNPDFKEKFSDYLKEKYHYDLCASTIKSILADDGYHSKSGRSQQDFYMYLVDVLTEHPDKVQCAGYTDIRQGMTKYPSYSGKLWVKMSDYFIRLGEFDSARSVLEEALNVIDNAKSFGIIFNAYCKFEEEMITALANDDIRRYYSVVEEDNVDHEINVRLKILYYLLSRQPYLLHRINIRNNGSNVKAWQSLIALHKQAGQLDLAIEVIKEAIGKVETDKVDNGRFSDIWIYYARILQKQHQLRSCNYVLQYASTVNYRLLEDYVSIWVFWVELLLEENYQQDALKVVKHVLFRKRSQHDGKYLLVKNVDDLLKSNTGLWQLYIDLYLSIGTFETAKVAYYRCKYHRCLTPIMLMNFTDFIWHNAYFYYTFRVFEFAVSNFRWPSLYEIWIDYIHKFISRYGNTPIGVYRARSMFYKLLKDVPQQYAGVFYFLYAKFYYYHGLYSHAVEIYDRMVNAVQKYQRLTAYSIYIAKVSKLLGVTKTRHIFEDALQKLPEKEILHIGSIYAQLEMNLGEIYRARAVYIYVNQFTDPRDDADGLWKTWEMFEVEHGDKETFKEYLRIKRSVEAKYEMLPPDLEKIEEKVKKGLV